MPVVILNNEQCEEIINDFKTREVKEFLIELQVLLIQSGVNSKGQAINKISEFLDNELKLST